MGQDPKVANDFPPAGVPVASEILRSLAARGEGAIPFGAVVDAAGSRIHGLALLLLVLPETLPLPLPSASSVLGVPLIMISGHLALFGERAGLPGRIRRLKTPRSIVAALARYVSPVLERLERWSRPRWEGIVRRERLIGLVCVYLSAILLLPIPFLNAPPAICLAAIAFGVIQRDGLMIALGMAGSVVLTAALAGIVVWTGSFF